MCYLNETLGNFKTSSHKRRPGILSSLVQRRYAEARKIMPNYNSLSPEAFMQLDSTFTFPPVVSDRTNCAGYTRL